MNFARLDERTQVKVGYARVSSREQSENTHALEQQRERLRQAGAEQIFTDVDSGTKDNRKAFQLLMEMVRSKACSEVIITRLDRLTRSLITLKKAIDVFVRMGVSLRALDDAIDTSTAGGRFHLNMLGSLAEMEVDRLSERVKHGWAHLRERKVAMNPPFGYVKVNDRHEIDHEPFLCLLSGEELSRAKIARDLIDIFLEVRSLRQAIKQVNLKYGIWVSGRFGQKGRVGRGLFRFSTAGLGSWLRNPVLRGHLAYLRKAKDRHRHKIVEHQHPALITELEYCEIERILAYNAERRGFGSTVKKYPLSGLLFCGECSSACYKVTTGVGQRFLYYRCKNSRIGMCKQTPVKADEVEAVLIKVLVSRARKIAQLAESGVYIESLELRELRGQLQGLELIGFNEAIEQAKANIRSQIELLEYQERTGNEVTVQQYERFVNVFENPLYFETLGEKDKLIIYGQLVKRIVVRDAWVESIIFFDGYKWNEPPPVKIKSPSRLVGGFLWVGDPVWVCFADGSKVLGKVVGDGRKSAHLGSRWLDVSVGGKVIKFSRRYGRPIIDGRTVPLPKAEMWLVIPDRQVREKVEHSDEDSHCPQG